MGLMTTGCEDIWVRVVTQCVIASGSVYVIQAKPEHELENENSLKSR